MRIMKSYVIHITDAARVDRQVVVSVIEPMNLGRAAHMAIDRVVDEEGAQLQFPIFLDIHPAEQFSGVAWMHRN